MFLQILLLAEWGIYPVAGRSSTADVPADLLNLTMQLPREEMVSVLEEPEKFMPLPLRIPVAEDEADDVWLLRRAFAKAGVQGQLAFVGDGRKAIDYLRESYWREFQVQTLFPGQPPAVQALAGKQA